jgi:DNA polymerase-3 subunit epsilon
VETATPLHDVTFVIVDLETTGMSPATAAITEVGAIKLRAGECLGTFQTMVDPGMPIPPVISFLTGITSAMVAPAPTIEAVLPSFLEFVGRETVIVGHNVRFDLSFLQAALERAGYPPLTHPAVDTCAIARRLVRDEVDNCKLSTLAYRFELASTPTHRALDDALACGDLLHCLLERSGTLGVTALDDLLVLPEVPLGPQLQKLRLATALPHRPGRFVFRDRGRQPLLDGEADDVHREARSYFLGAPRKRITQLVRQTAAIEYVAG